MFIRGLAVELIFKDLLCMLAKHGGNLTELTVKK